MSGPESWYMSAESRWSHLPNGPDREARIRHTFNEIREEAEAVAVRLPELTNEEKCALVEEAVLDAFQRYGCPTTDEADELFDCHVERIFFRLCIRAREAKSEPRVRSKLLERRLFRGPGVRLYLGLAPE